MASKIDVLEPEEQKDESEHLNPNKQEELPVIMLKLILKRLSHFRRVTHKNLNHLKQTVIELQQN